MTGNMVSKWLSAALDHYMHSSELDSIPRKRIHPAAAMQAAHTYHAKLLESKIQTPEDWIACGGHWSALDEVDKALECFNIALSIKPDHPLALDGLATALKTSGELKSAIKYYRAALEHSPSNIAIFQNLLFAMLCTGDVDDAEIFQWHRRFSQRFEAPIHKKEAAHRRVDPNRRIRVGYVSADLRAHVVGGCIAPVLARHDRKRFQLYCYYDGRLADAITASMRRVGDTWRDMSTLDDAQLCKQIAADRIDILVDLSGHTPGNRILAFARKPAPIQVSYLDYSATTGLDSMDYRFTPAASEPDDQAQDFYSEKLVRLKSGYWVYERQMGTNEPSPMSVTTGKTLLFSCLNSFYRVSDEAIYIWATILQRLPKARLALVGVPDGRARERVFQRFHLQGIKATRIEVFGVLHHSDYLQLVRATDVALAPFPYNGAMTMLDCLWHGVPVVCFKGGRTFRSSMAEAIYGLLDMQQYIAQDAANYAKIAIQLANDASLRSTFRLNLRSRMLGSVLCNATGFTREIEAAYLDFWQKYNEMSRLPIER